MDSYQYSPPYGGSPSRKGKCNAGHLLKGRVTLRPLEPQPCHSGYDLGEPRRSTGGSVCAQVQHQVPVVVLPVPERGSLWATMLWVQILGFTHSPRSETFTACWSGSQRRGGNKILVGPFDHCRMVPYELPLIQSQRSDIYY